MVNFKRLADKAKDVVDQRGGTDALKQDANELKGIAKGKGSLKDKAMAAKDAIKDPGAARREGTARPEPRERHGDDRPVPDERGSAAEPGGAGPGPKPDRGAGS